MKDIDYYIGEVKRQNLNGGVHRTKVYSFIDDGVILVNKREKDFYRLQETINASKNMGISIPAYIDYKEDSDGCFVLEELAPGQEFAFLVNDEDGCRVLERIPYEHIEKYIRDVFLLGSNGIGVEPRRRNIFYDENKGFTTIDVALSKKDRNYSLDEVNYFFSMFYPVFMINFNDDELGKSVKQKTVLKVIKAFENGHPYFKQYSRWIYRNNDYVKKLLEANGADLSLNEDEVIELYSYIENLIQLLINRVLNNEDMFYGLYSYIDLLSSSITLVSDFELFDITEISLEKYLKSIVNERLKQMFFDNPDDFNLRQIYFKIRRREIDPVNIYSVDDVCELIEDELKEMISNKVL